MIKHYIVIGSSRGLGAALVEKLLSKGCIVTGLARTPSSEISNFNNWARSGRYKHIQLDLTSPECQKILKTINTELEQKPIGVILNAALMISDVNPNSSINIEMLKEVNQVQIGGLGEVLRAFQPHFLPYGGF